MVSTEPLKWLLIQVLFIMTVLFGTILILTYLVGTNILLFLYAFLVFTLSAVGFVIYAIVKRK